MVFIVFVVGRVWRLWVCCELSVLMWGMEEWEFWCCGVSFFLFLIGDDEELVFMELMIFYDLVVGFWVFIFIFMIIVRGNYWMLGYRVKKFFVLYGCLFVMNLFWWFWLEEFEFVGCEIWYRCWMRWSSIVWFFDYRKELLMLFIFKLFVFFLLKVSLFIWS